MQKFRFIIFILLIALSGCTMGNRRDISVPAATWEEISLPAAFPEPNPPQAEWTAPENTAAVTTQATDFELVEIQPIPEPDAGALQEEDNTAISIAAEPSAAGAEADVSWQQAVPAQPSGLQQVALTLSDGSSVNCWLYLPEAPADNPGLIVYLHGGSGKGNDLNRILQAGGFPQYLQSGQLGPLSCYVLIPQLPEERRGWSDMDGRLMEMIQAVVEDYGIDSANISLTGHSMGGTGTWAIAANHPGFFARIAPLSGSIRNTPENVYALQNTPVYAFVGMADAIVDPEASIAFVQSLISAGGTAQIAEIADADHFSIPAYAYLGNYGLLAWLQGM